MRSAGVKKVRRCAIYVRKSSEEGLEQDFNSLHAQRESCEAYINSQKHEGWIVLPTVYEDGGYSAGSMERPALQRLLSDIKNGAVDVVVVYKVDRLTRSLTDFAKIVDIFDAANVSFVSITQQFNTSTSMGRLTLNVLLSFAQFEREVTGERIRDKIAASKKKGMWMGGWVPLGYDRNDRTLAINETEAKTVRTVFESFVKLKNVRDVQTELTRLGLRTKPHMVKGVRSVGNLPFSRGHIYRILTNRIYIGEIQHKGMSHSGQHPALINTNTWHAVQTQLTTNRQANRTRFNAKSCSLLSGLVFDTTGNRLVSSHTTKNGKRYRYYVTSAGSGRTLSADHTDQARVPSPRIENAVISSLTQLLANKQRLAGVLHKHRFSTAQISAAFRAAGELTDVLSSGLSSARRSLISAIVQRVIVTQGHLRVEIKPFQLCAVLLDEIERPATEVDCKSIIELEVKFDSSKRGRAVLAEPTEGARPRPDAVLIKAIARARAWFDQLITGKAKSMADIAVSENITDNYVSNLIHLAWLPPRQIELIFEGDAVATKLARIAMQNRRVDLIWTTISV